jgi:hypothetical protein
MLHSQKAASPLVRIGPVVKMGMRLPKKNCFSAEALLEGRTSFAIMNFGAPSRCAMTSLVLFELIITEDGI